MSAEAEHGQGDEGVGVLETERHAVISRIFVFMLSTSPLLKACSAAAVMESQCVTTCWGCSITVSDTAFTSTRSGPAVSLAASRRAPASAGSGRERPGASVGMLAMYTSSDGRCTPS